MEVRLNRVKAWLKTGTGDVAEDVRILDDYYHGAVWRSDLEADEAGELPADLPRGVLSEDGIYDALEEYRERVKELSFENAAAAIPPGRYRHFKGNEYEVIGIARHSEDESPMVVYRALYGDGGLWVRPAAMWNEEITRDGTTCKRFTKV